MKNKPQNTSKYMQWDYLDKKYPKEPNYSARVLAVSVAFFVYLSIFREYIIDMLNLWKRQYIPGEYTGFVLNKERAIIYSFLIIPFFIAYVVYMLKDFTKIEYLAKFTYPLIAINLIAGFNTCTILEPSDGMMWVLILAPAVPICFIIGVIKDLKYITLLDNVLQGKNKQGSHLHQRSIA